MAIAIGPHVVLLPIDKAAEHFYYGTISWDETTKDFVPGVTLDQCVTIEFSPEGLRAFARFVTSHIDSFDADLKSELPKWLQEIATEKERRNNGA